MKFQALPRMACFAIPLLSLAACSSTLGGGSIGPSAYASAGCNELNGEVKTVSAEISRVAVVRGDIANTKVPNWVPGGRRGATVIVDRQTTRIENLRQQEQAILAARNRNCAG